MNFDGVFFKGSFRDYQQRVLDNSKRYLDDRKINIVAAPGSGKTILGLELIKRLNHPCIILSPTTTIRQQWGRRFEESFEFDKNRKNEYVSYDLNEVTLINSITYQALYSAMNKIATATEDEVVDYSNIELFQLMKKYDIKTICLDEAHHLQNEWQKALEKFIKGLDKDIVVISLTATPPYDANKAEWERYVAVSGEIDDEIFVPELVRENTLCHHQDFIVFNFPTEGETNDFKKQYSGTFKAIAEICSLDCVRGLNKKIEVLYKEANAYVYQFFAEIVAVMILLHQAGIGINKRLFKKLTNSSSVPSLNKKYAERSVNFLLKEEVLNDKEKESIKAILKKYSLFERNHAIFDLSEKQKRELVSSVGKLESIKKIVENESENLQEKLRMLILTDYIKKESLSNIGTDTNFNDISVVSIFETIRRGKPNAKVACVSGTLVILSKDVVDELTANQDIKKRIKSVEINGTNFYNVSFKGDNREKVDIISDLFEKGNINVLVGTQALLGEGWDSPCINSLILASYVGSFMLSNQMRGRAIRIDKNNPNKVSNIWHLVSIEPDYMFENNLIDSAFAKLFADKEKLSSCDFETLKRRFDCFVGPNYDTNEIESGIDRITIIKPPYTKSGIDKMNEQTFEKAKDREFIRETWKNAVDVPAKTRTDVVVQIPKECRVPAFTFYNIASLLIYTMIVSAVFGGMSPISKIIVSNNPTLIVCLIAAAIIVLATFFFKGLLLTIIRNISPKKSIETLGKAILKTMKETELINPDARLAINTDDMKVSITMTIRNASVYEQNIFNESIRELLSPIENPRYVIIKRDTLGHYDFSKSYACPSIISKTDYGVECLKKHFNAVGDIDVIYTHYDTGREFLFKCRKKSYITQNYKLLNKKYKFTKFE